MLNFTSVATPMPFSTHSKLFPIAFSIDCCFHYMGKNLCNLGSLLSERAKSAGVESNARKLQSIARLSTFSTGMQKFESNHEHEPLFMKKLADSCTNCFRPTKKQQRKWIIREIAQENRSEAQALDGGEIFKQSVCACQSTLIENWGKFGCRPCVLWT